MNYKILDISTGTNLHEFTSRNDSEAGKEAKEWLERIVQVHGEDIKFEYTLKEVVDEDHERTVMENIGL